MIWLESWFIYYIFGWFAVWFLMILGLGLLGSIGGYFLPTWKYRIDVPVQQLSVVVDLSPQVAIERLKAACIPYPSLWSPFIYFQQPVPVALKWISDQRFELRRAKYKNPVYVQGEINSDLGQTVIHVMQRSSLLNIVILGVFMLNPIAVSDPALFAGVFSLVLIAAYYYYLQVKTEVQQAECFLTDLFGHNIVKDRMAQFMHSPKHYEPFRKL